MQTIPVSRSQHWDEKILNSRAGTIFHSSAWAKVIKSAYGHSTELYECANGSLLPITEIKSPITGKRGHCIPFADRCAILGTPKNGFEEFAAATRKRGWKYLEIRGGSGVPVGASSSAEFLRHTIQLDAESENRFSQSTKRGVKKAERSGLIARMVSPSDSSGIERYYKLHEQTRRRHGIPPQPMRFFRAIQEHVIAKDLGFIVEVEKKKTSKVIASAVFFEFGETAFYKFGASDVSEWNLRPNNLLFAHAIRSLCEKNRSKILDLGRSDLPDTELHRFKRGWGAQEEALYYFRFHPDQNDWVGNPSSKIARERIHHSIFRAMPLKVNRIAGSLLYPHLS